MGKMKELFMKQQEEMVIDESYYDLKYSEYLYEHKSLIEDTKRCNLVFIPDNAYEADNLIKNLKACNYCVLCESYFGKDIKGFVYELKSFEDLKKLDESFNKINMHKRMSNCAVLPNKSNTIDAWAYFSINDSISI